jgi:hypothetical protein
MSPSGMSFGSFNRLQSLALEALVIIPAFASPDNIFLT